MNRHLTALVLAGLFLIAPLAGCFGEEEKPSVEPEDALQIDFVNPEDAVLRAGEFHDFTLVGEGNSICLLYTSPSPRDSDSSRMPSSA